MKINRVLTISILSLMILPELAFAQSFWIHRQAFPPSGFRRIYQIHANDTSECMIMSASPNLAQTMDGAQSWENVSGGFNEFSTPCFVHPTKNLIILGCNTEKTLTRVNGNVTTQLNVLAGHILRSTDAGKTWSDTALGFLDTTKVQNSIGSMAALDSNHIFLPIDAKSFNPSDSDHFLHSSDGGVTWQSIPCPVSVHYRGSADPTTLWITPVAAYPAPNTLVIAEWDAYCQDKIYRTTDLGKTWDTGFQMNDNTTGFAFINPLLGFASGFIYNSSAQSYTATIDKTTDGGAIWTTIFSKAMVPPSGFFKNTAGLFGIAFADSLHGLAVGDEGLILQTTDGGSTWNEMASDYTFDTQGLDLLGGVAYPDTNHAIIASSSGEALVYAPGGILSLPNITYPKFSPPSAPRSFDITWDAVPGATRYAIQVMGSIEHVNDTLIARDPNVTATAYHLSNLPDTSSLYQAVQYEITLQAFNATNESNVATRVFIVYHTSSGVTITPVYAPTQIEVHPNPATHWLTIQDFSGPLTIYDALGRARECPRADGKLNVANLPPGIYYVSDGMRRARFVKE